MQNVALFLCLLGVFPVQAFLQQFKSGAATIKSSPQADEAVAVFNELYPFDREPLKRSALDKLSSFGVPEADLDGTQIRQYDPSKGPGKRLSDITEKEARATFNEMSKLYGAENALEMTKAQPICLTFDKSLFAASLKEYVTIFGEEEAKAMVCRNPGLLAIRPSDAAKATDQTMQASYLIAATRPFGNVALPALLALILIPAIESVTGIPIRSTFLSTLTGASPEDVANVYTKIATPIWSQF